MRKTVCWLLSLMVLSSALVGYAQLQVPGVDNTPKIGEKPPDFELSQGRGGSIGMKDFVGKKRVLLAFFPMAFTAGWTREFTEFGINQAKFDELNIEVIGISRDLTASQQKFKESVSAKNTFLSDPEAKVIGAYGALNAQRLANRYYFLIDENGALIWKSVTGQLMPVEKLVTDLAAVVKK